MSQVPPALPVALDFFPAGSDQTILLAVDDTDDPASTGAGAASYDKGTVYGPAFRPGGTQNIWEMASTWDSGAVWSRSPTAILGAQGGAGCPVKGTE